MTDEPLKGLVLNIQHFCTHDGPGIRTTVFSNSDLLISDRCEWSGVIAKLFAESMRPTRKAG